MPNEIAKLSPTDELRKLLEKQEPEFKKVLPPSIAPQRLTRVVMTAVQQNPDLLQADRRSLLGACMKCGHDGLLPDSREAALVIFNTKVVDRATKAERWEKRVQYMPMVYGLLKRMRNSGDVSAVIAQLVHERDLFIQTPDDFDKPLQHRPPPLGTDRGRLIGAYALAKLRDGTLVSEVMSLAQIEEARAVSRAKNEGPWVKWYGEMGRKTVLRRLAKWLPMDSDDDRLERAMVRDDALGEPQGDADAGPAIIEGTAEPMSRMDAIEQGLPADTTLDLGRSREREPARDEDLPWDERDGR